MQGGLPRVVGLIAILGVLAGCSSTSPAPRSASVATTTTTGPSFPKPSAGCAAAGAPSPRGNTVQRVTSDGVAHQYLLSVPAKYKSTQPAPLVLLFSGFGSDAQSFAALTKMPTIAAARGVIVATPEGPNNTWQLSGSGSDAAFVDAMVASLEKTLCVDLSRVYASGFSQGAAFTILYACKRPDRIAAIATVAVEFQLGCKQPMSILAFHGTDDPAVPYRNGAMGASLPGVKVRGTLLNMRDWATLDRCDPTPANRKLGTEITLKVWLRCVNGTAITLYTIEHGSHTWPGANPAASPLYTTQQINATKLILRFFAQHQLIPPSR